MSPDDIRQRAEYPGLKAMLPSQEREMLLALATLYEASDPGTCELQESMHHDPIGEASRCRLCNAWAAIAALPNRDNCAAPTHHHE